MELKQELQNVLNGFPFSGNLESVETKESGLINTTYVVGYSDNGNTVKYVLQKINTNVFKNPDQLMENVIGVTSFLREKIKSTGGNADRETLSFVKTNDNKNFYRDENGECWRAYKYIDDCYTCDSVDSQLKACRTGKAFGVFQGLLADYPIDKLYDTIPNFHNTPSRYNDLQTAIENNISGRKNNVLKEIEFAQQRLADASKITDMLKNGLLPLRVTHNDTKINNILFDSKTNQPFCVIDLDTIMPGSSLYDYGDSIRSGAVSADENTDDFSKVKLDTELYTGYSKGFIEGAGKALCEAEIENLAFSAKLMTLECGVRFLTDYLNGDTYFKTEYADHNLTRCRNQFHVVSDIEDKLEKLQEIDRENYRRLVLE